MTSPFNAIKKAGPFFVCLFFILYASSFGQAIRPITVSEALSKVDDNGSERAGLGFQINFNGIRYDNVWVNNNGNLTFSGALSTYTPYLIQQNSQPMFAAFFADVDTRNYGDVTRYGRSTLTVDPGNTRDIFCINWINVGCFALSNSAIVNSFQMIIIDRSDIAPGDFDLEYNYDKITWEAGTASGGNSYGLGGSTTASMGWSNGTNTFYSHPGSLTAGSFLDAGPRSLINNRLNSDVNGRYVFSVRNGVVVEDIVLSPGADTNIVGTIDTLVAYVHDDDGNPVAGRKVFFQILSGPHSPRTDSSVTDASGSAYFIYTGTSTGLDEIVAMMQRPTLDTAFSNHASHLWNPIPNLRPTTSPVTVTDTISATPIINWTYNDPESDPQSQYEVEVWTGPNGSGTSMWNPSVGSGTLTSVTYGGATLVSSQIYYARVRAYDGSGWGDWSEASWIAGSLPVAEAGVNRVIATGPDVCTAEYTLDGTGSSGEIISYSWTGPFGTITGPGATVTLPLGINWIYLTVTNTFGSSMDSVTITIADSTAPIPDVDSLQEIHVQCSATLTAPTATDKCSAPVTATTLDPYSYTVQGTYTVHWIYTDAAGNKAYQLQTVVVRDTVAPVPSIEALLDIEGICSVTLTAPTADDSCSGTISGTTTDSLTYVTQGSRTVHWTYIDAAGNMTNQEQKVIVRDTIRPSIVCSADTTVTISASNTKTFIALKPATASDNCTGAILPIATRQDGLPLDSGYSIGMTEVKWDACDGNGNCADTVQRITVRLNHRPQLSVITDTTIEEKMPIALVITASDSDGNIPLISSASTLPPGCSVTDKGDGTALLSWNTGCNDHGTYALSVKAFDGIDSTLDTVHVSVADIDFPPVFLSAGDTNQHAIIQKSFSYTVRTQDCDGTSPTLRAINLPSGASFTDNHDGTGSVVWTPLASESGYYMVIFEAKDDVTAVRDTIIIVVEDESHFTPAITVSSLDTTVGVNLPLTLFVSAKVQDGTIPILSAVSLPTDARITFDSEGCGVFSWTPHATGTDSLVLIARHVLDSTLQTRCVVKINVDNRNITGPVFLARGDTAIDQKTELALTV
ncbi:MAG TPA: nidogen-like domain-containing protein, partial [Chitinispirillaceae bacterium]|nr:nidogen-like domain-containing protein [Chitinispirillaceae bacterium]